jgi:hypothetical protein
LLHIFTYYQFIAIFSSSLSTVTEEHIKGPSIATFLGVGNPHDQGSLLRNIVARLPIVGTRFGQQWELRSLLDYTVEQQ